MTQSCCAGAAFLSTTDSGPGPAVWHVAWSGAAAVGASLDVPAALAQCLCLPAGITVSVRLTQGSCAANMQLAQVKACALS